MKDPGFDKLLRYSVEKDLLKHGGGDYTKFLKSNGANLTQLMHLKIWNELMKRQDAVELMARSGFPRLMRNAHFHDLVMRQEWGSLTYAK
jgi:hypothetical protein